MLAKPTVKKEPFSVDMLTVMVEDTSRHETLSNVRLTAACLLAYSGFLCFDELAKLRPIDLFFDDQKLTVAIRQSKTDQLRQGDTVVIARTDANTCPVRMLEKYMAMGGVDKQDTGYLFRGITKSKAGEKLRVSGSLSYTRMRELLKQKLLQLGYPPGSYGIHSLRAGGATAAANAGIAD